MSRDEKLQAEKTCDEITLTAAEDEVQSSVDTANSQLPKPLQNADQSGLASIEKQAKKDSDQLGLPYLKRGLLIAVSIASLIFCLCLVLHIDTQLFHLQKQPYFYLGISWAALLTSIPLQVYWTAGLIKSSKAISLKYKTKPPASKAFLIFLAACSWLMTPCIFQVSDQSNAESIQQYLWLGIQFICPLIFLFQMLKQDAGLKMATSLRSVAVALFCSWLLLIDPKLFLSPVPILLQFIWLQSITGLLRRDHRKDLANRKKRKVVAGDDIVINYSPFAAFTRWRKEQEGALNRDLKPIILLGLPFLAFCYHFGLQGATNIERQLRPALPQRASGASSGIDYRESIIRNEIRSYQLEVRDSFFVALKRENTVIPAKTLYGLHIFQDGSYEISYVNNGRRIGKPGSELQPEEWKRRKKLIENLPKLPSPPEAVSGDLNGTVYFPSQSLEAMQVRFSIESTPAIKEIRSYQRVAAAPPKDDSRQANSSFLLYAGLASFAAIFGLAFYAGRKPSHIGISKEGIRFIWRRPFKWEDGQYFQWSQIQSIAIEKAKNSTSSLDNSLVFKKSDARTFKIKMGVLESIDERELLLKAIEKWALEVPRDAAVSQSLQAPPDYSYTELWLQALSAPPKRERLKPLSSGTLLKDGRYEVIEQIGVGGQGNAYLCFDESRQKVVLKESVLPVFVNMNVRKSALEQFENEARLLRQLDHDQIVKLQDFFVEDHRTYLVLEHIDGRSLQAIVKDSGAFSEKEVCNLAAQMCEMLSYLHGLAPPVVHRDFTPDNLILRKDGTLKLIDFTVAKQVLESTTSGTVVGKHAYLPPEQFRGMPVPASDIYAMGATLCFLISGRDPAPLSKSSPGLENPSISKQLNAIIEKATELDLNKRYKNLQELKDDLIVLL